MDQREFNENRNERIDRNERIIQLAEEFMPGMVEFTRKVIQCPSLSGEEGDVAALYADECRKLGFDEVFTDEWGNVTGIVRGTEEGPTIMYNGHMDHVDIGDVSEWEGYDPYGGQIDICEIENEMRTGVEMAECIHGRAAADVKAGIACQIYSGGILVRLKKEGYPVKGNYMFTGVVLEEPAEQIGMITLLETLKGRQIPVHGVVSCEATGLRLYLGHRGRVEIQVEVQGITSHGSAPWLGINAVNKATKLIQAIEEKYQKDFLVDEKLGKSSIALTVINCSPGSMCIVPDRCRITFDRRLVPQETPEEAVQQIQELIDEMTEQDADFRATVSVAAVSRKSYTNKEATLPNIKQGWKIEEDHPFVKAAARALEYLGEPVSYGYWDFGTDLAVVCGKHKIAAIGYSPMQELYCHRPVDKVRTDFMKRALVGDAAIFNELTHLEEDDFLIP